MKDTATALFCRAPRRELTTCTTRNSNSLVPLPRTMRASGSHTPGPIALRTSAGPRAHGPPIGAPLEP